MTNRGSSLDESLSAMPVIAILRGSTKNVLADLEWLVATGVRIVEVTTNTPGWQSIVGMAMELQFEHVGVGTVLTAEHVAEAASLGATFTVSPGLDLTVVRSCEVSGLAHLPGVATASEIQSALKNNLSILKLFPAAALGLDYLRSLRGPFDQVRFVATGGITPQTAHQWLDAGAFGVGIGGSLFSSQDDARAQVTTHFRRLAR